MVEFVAAARADVDTDRGGAGVRKRGRDNPKPVREDGFLVHVDSLYDAPTGRGDDSPLIAIDRGIPVGPHQGADCRDWCAGPVSEGQLAPRVDLKERANVLRC